MKNLHKLTHALTSRRSRFHGFFYYLQIKKSFFVEYEK